MSLEETGERAAGEVLDVHRQHRPPTAAHRTGERAPGVGEREIEDASLLEQLPCDVKGMPRLDEVLEHVAHHHQSAGAHRDGGIVQLGGANVEAAGPGPLRSPPGRLDARGVPPSLPRRDEERTRPAPQIAHQSGWHHLLDPCECTPGGLDLARLFSHRDGVGRFGVGAGDGIGIGHPVEAAVAARQAAHERARGAAESLRAGPKRLGVDPRLGRGGVDREAWLGPAVAAHGACPPGRDGSAHAARPATRVPSMTASAASVPVRTPSLIPRS